VSSSGSSTTTSSGPAAPAGRGEVALLACLVTFVVAVEWTWLARDPFPDLTGDDAGVARCVFALLAWWRDGTPYRPEILAGAPYPPLAVYAGALGAAAADALDADPVLGMLRGQSLFLVALVVGAWFAVRRALGVPAAVAAALMAPVYGWWAYRGQMFVDMQLGACLVAAVGAWAASEGLRRPLPSGLFGTALAGALLTKFSAAFFAGIPGALAAGAAVAGLSAHRARMVGGICVAGGLVACIAASAGSVSLGVAGAMLGLSLALAGALAWRAPAEDARTRLASLMLAAGGLALAAPWYASNLDALRVFLSRNLGQSYDGAVYPWVYVWWVYPSVLFRGAVDELVTVMALLGVLCMRRQGLRGPTWLAAAMVLGGCVLLTMQPYRTPRYIVPAAGLVVVAAVGALGWLDRARTAAAICLAVAAAWVWGSAPFGTPMHPEDRRAWWNRVTWVPPNAPQTLAQQRAAAFDPLPRVHTALPGPMPSPFALRSVADAVSARVDVTRVRLLELEGGLPPWACSSLALQLVARGADPYLTCGGGRAAQVRVSTSEAPADLITIGGPFDVQGLYVHVAPALVRSAP
jgi:hypothetical protein